MDPVSPPEAPRGALMVCGTASGVGKSMVVAGLCRLLARRGVRVAPFKAQNMSNNAAVTADGSEIGRAQYAQALAAGVAPEAAMNPVLLKPIGERSAQVVVAGRPWGTTDAAEWGDRAVELRPVVEACLDDVRARFDVVVLEGAGGAAEINLLDRDVVNLPLAARAGIPAIVVGDIDRGGVFASLYGTVALLPDELRRCVRGLVINKFRGDPSLLGDGPATLGRRVGVPVLGVLPWVPGADVDLEDSLDLGAAAPTGGPEDLDIAAIRFPRVANSTDLEPLAAEPSVAVRWVDHVGALGAPDLVVLPGSRHTVADLEWFRSTGLAGAVAASGAHVVGICGGYQMLGREIADDVESGRGRVAGLGWLAVDTQFEAAKVVRLRAGCVDGSPVRGYEIRHGRPRAQDPGWVHLDDEHGRECEGAVADGGRIRGTSVHGLFEADGFRHRFLAELAAARRRPFRPGAVGFAEHRAARFDALADLPEAHLDVDAVLALVGEGDRR